MSSLFTFLLSPFGKIVGLLGVALFAVGIGSGLYESFVGHLQEEQKLRDQQAQYEQVIKEQADTIEKQKALIEIQTQSAVELEQTATDIIINGQTVMQYLMSDEAAKADKPVGEVLKKTFKIMGESK